MELVRVHTLRSPAGSVLVTPGPVDPAEAASLASNSRAVPAVSTAIRLAPPMCTNPKLTWIQGAFGGGDFPVASDDGLLAGPCAAGPGVRTVTTAQLPLKNLQHGDLLYFEASTSCGFIFTSVFVM